MKWTDAYKDLRVNFKKRGETKIFGPFDDWTKGRSFYYSFLIKVEDRKVVKKIVEAQERLKRFPFISLHPPHFFHISLKALGFWDTAKKFDDSLDQKDVDRWVAKAEKVATQVNSFDLVIKGLNSFANSTVCQLHDESGNLLRLISGLEGKMFDEKKSRIPHLTVGYYTEAEKNGALVEQLKKLKDFEMGTLQVDRFQLIKHNSVGQIFYEPLVTVREFRLVT